MKVYIEQLLIINFFLDFILLYSTKKILNRTTSIKRIILSSLLGSILSLSNKTNIIKLIISIIMILISFSYKNIIQNLIYFYLLSIILGGTLYLFELNIYKLNYIIILIISPVLIYLYIKELNNYKKNISNIYEVEIQIDNTIYKLKALLDTGNSLIDPYKKRPIILTNLNINYKKYKYLMVPFNALNTSGIIPCIKPDKIIINNKIYKDYLIGISNMKFNIKTDECILPNKLMEDL